MAFRKFFSKIKANVFISCINLKSYLLVSNFISNAFTEENFIF